MTGGVRVVARRGATVQLALGRGPALALLVGCTGAIVPGASDTSSLRRSANLARGTDTLSFGAGSGNGQFAGIVA
jgi:hypothetical protein